MRKGRRGGGVLPTPTLLKNRSAGQSDEVPVGQAVTGTAGVGAPQVLPWSGPRSDPPPFGAWELEKAVDWVGSDGRSRDLRVCAKTDAELRHRYEIPAAHSSAAVLSDSARAEHREATDRVRTAAGRVMLGLVAEWGLETNEAVASAGKPGGVPTLPSGAVDYTATPHPSTVLELLPGWGGAPEREHAEFLHATSMVAQTIPPRVRPPPGAASTRVWPDEAVVLGHPPGRPRPPPTAPEQLTRAAKQVTNQLDLNCGRWTKVVNDAARLPAGFLPAEALPS